MARTSYLSCGDKDEYEHPEGKHCILYF
jgi:hypothetical protein